MIPTSYEVAQLVEETLRLTNSHPDELARHSELSTSIIKKATKATISPTNLRLLNKGITGLINEKLDPFRPPVIGFEQEWLPLQKAIRDYLRAMQADTLDPVNLKPARKPRRHPIDESRDIKTFKKEIGR